MDMVSSDYSSAPVLDVSSYLTAGRILIGIGAANKEALLLKVSSLLSQDTTGHSATDIFDTFMARESLGSTGIERGVAIPHGRLSSLKQPIMAFATTIRPINFGALDERPSDLFFILLAPQKAPDSYLKILADLSKLLHHQEFALQLRACQSPDAVLQCIKHWEATKTC